MRGVGITVYGTEGVGKTGFCLQAVGPLLFLSVKETGYLDLEDIGEVPDGCENITVDNWYDLLREVKQALDYRTVIIDSLSGIQKLLTAVILEEIYSKENNAEKAFGSFSEGHRVHAPNYMNIFTTALDFLRSKGINVFLIGHDKLETHANPIGDDFESTVIDLEKWSRAIITQWSQAVLFMTLDAETMATREWRGKVTEAKVQNDVLEDCPRIIYTTKHPAHSAKNRLKLPVYLRMGDSAEEAYNNFYKVLPQKIKEVLKP